jgi:putative heme-binding domain-containing protein
LELEDGQASQTMLSRLAELAASDPSPRVRLELASGLQRLPVIRRRAIAEGLASHGEDADDDNLPLMVWYGVEPLVAENQDAALALLTRSELPLVREHIGRRLAFADKLEGTIRAVAATGEPARQRDLLRGIYQALEGRRDAAPPNDWSEAAGTLMTSGDADVRETALALGVLYGDRSAVDSLTATVLDRAAETEPRQRALAVLVRQRVEGIAPTLQALLDDAALRAAAIRGLASYDDATTPKELLARYADLTDAERTDVVATLSVRPEYALALLSAIEGGTLSRGEVTPFAARQLLALSNEAVTEKLAAVWGAIRPAAEGKAERIAHYKTLLAPDNVQGADLTRGRLLFTKQCGACHRLFEAGGRIGPELTGAQRMNLDYVLENLLDPSAVVPRDYQVSTFQTDDGRVVTGIVLRETDDAVTVQTQNDQIVLPKSEVDERQPSPLSMMPEGILATLTDEEVRDLVAYLASPSAPAE